MSGSRGKVDMATLDEIGQDKQRVSERLARLDTERARLADQLSELEIAERVLTEFGRKGLRARDRTGSLAGTAPAGEPSARGGTQMGTVAVRDAVLKAVEAGPEGAAASEILAYVSQEFGLKVRPNHLGMALQRHRRAGRPQLRDQRWYMPPSP
jgi:hypothetical protein